MKRLYFVNTGDDLIEGVFDESGKILGAWSPNDANWRNEYFAPFLEAVGIECLDGTEEHENELRAYSMTLWGLTAEEAGLTD